MDNQGEIDMDPTDGCNPTRLKKEKLEEKLASLFITKFVNLYLFKFVQYSKLCGIGGVEDCKDKLLPRTIGGIVGGIVGGGSGLLLFLSPASASAGASLGSLGAAAIDKKYRTIPKAKIVTGTITTAYSSSTDEIYSPRAQKRFLTSVLIEGAAQIFHTFQTQITQIWHAAEEQEADRTFTKLALDAVARSIDYICVNTQNETFSADTVCAGVLHGSSKKSLKAKLSFTMLGYEGYNFRVNNSTWNTSEMFKGTAIMVKGREQENDVLYIKKNAEKYRKYGFRIWSNCQDEESQNLFRRNKPLANAGYIIAKSVPKAENTFSSYISQKQLDCVVADVLKGFEDEDYTLRFDSIEETLKAILMEVGEGRENIIEGQMLVLENQMSNHEEVLANFKKLQDRPSFEPRLTTILNFPATPKRDLSFVGRMKITESVITALIETRDVVPFVNLHALGGFGKTQLARNVVQQSKARELFDHHIWIDSETEDAIIKDFGILVKCMNEVSDPEVNHIKFYNKLKGHKMLMVFDNVDNLDVLKKYLPHNYTENTSVLVTARMKLDGGVTVSIIAIPVPRFEDDDSLLLINAKLNSEEEYGDPQELIVRSEGIPLILHIMCSTILFFRRINGQQYTIQKYLNEHAEASLLYLDEGDPLSFELNYDRSLRKSVEIAVNYLRKDNVRIRKLAVTIFDRIAYLSPDGVSLEYLSGLSDISSEATTIGSESIPKLNLKETIQYATEFLEKFGIVTRNQEMSLTIHRSLQFVRRIALKEEEEEVLILQSLGQSLPNLYSKSTVSNICEYSRGTNFIALWNHLSKDKDLLTRFYPLKATFLQLAFYKSEEGLRNMVDTFGLDTAIQYILGEIHFRICNHCPKQEQCPTPSIFEMIHRFKSKTQLPFLNSACRYHTGNGVIQFLVQSLQKVYPLPLNFKERILSCSTSDCDNMFLMAAANSLGATPVEYVMTEMVHNTAFLVFSLQDNSETVFKDLPNFDVNVMDISGRTVLFHILDGGNIESESLAKQLLEKGADPGIANAYNGFNALHIAASRGKCDAVQAILQRRKDLLESKTRSGQTPLHLAIRHVQTARMLLKFDANVNAKDEKGRTPLMKAVEVCAAEVVKLFLDNNADLNIITTGGSRIRAIHLRVEDPSLPNQNLKEIINIFLHHYDGADLQDAGGTVSHLRLEIFFKVLIPPKHTVVKKYRMRLEVEKCSMHRTIPNEECLNTLKYWKYCNLELEKLFKKIKSESGILI